MKYTRALFLAAALVIAGSAFISAVSAETNMQKHEFLMIKVATPEYMEIEIGDTVTWRNMQRPKFPMVLISDEGLWDDQTIYYGKMFSYTFEEVGTYTFSAKDNPAISGTIIVSERRMPSVDAPGTGDTMAPEPAAVMVREQLKTRITQQTTARINEFLIIRTVTPESMEIHAGDTVTWRNMQRPKFPVTLVSDEDLWDDQTIYYGKVFSYTFEEPGIYTFSAKDNPAVIGRVVVTERVLPSVADVPDNGYIMPPGPELVMGNGAGERERMMEHAPEELQEQLMVRTNEFLMVRTITPGTIEIDSGETVTWRNLQRPKFSFVLVSDDDLWDDQTIYYGKVFTYKFEEPGIYTFSVENRPSIKVTVIVK